MQRFARALVAADAAPTAEEDVTVRVAVRQERFQGLPATTHIPGAALDGPPPGIETGEMGRRLGGPRPDGLA